MILLGVFITGVVAGIVVSCFALYLEYRHSGRTDSTPPWANGRKL